MRIVRPCADLTQRELRLMSNNKKTLQKKAGKVAEAMEDLLDSAKDMFQ